MSESTINGGKWLPTGYTMNSPNRRYTLTYQTDGNLVLYAGGQPLWASGTSGRSTNKAIMQTDGNFVVYDASNRAVWSSGTWGNAGARVALQDDGNLVVYSSSGRALWNSGTWGGRVNIQPPQTQQCGGWAMGPGGSFSSPNGRYTLAYQNDGNLVIYGPGQPLWQSGTSGRLAGRVTMQADGNLVVYDGSNRAVWNSGTWGNPGARLALQDDGNLVIYDTGGRALWSSGTYGGRSTIGGGGGGGNVLESMLGIGKWQSSTYSGTTVDVIRLNDGTIQVSWNTGGSGPLTQEGNTLRVRQTVPASDYNVVANVADVSSGRIVWKWASNGAYNDTWKKLW